MSDTTFLTDLDSTIRLLEQDPASADLAVAILLIERWEEQLQGTDLFADLSELKQAILNGSTHVESLLTELGKKTSALATSTEAESAEVAQKIKHLGQLLTQVGGTSAS